MGQEVERVEIKVADITLVADFWPGESDRRPVYLLHGGGQTRHSWRRTSLRLADAGWPVLAPDARGHGESDWAPNRRYVVNDFAADIAILSRRAPLPPVLVGASLGGVTSLLAAAENPGIAAGLVLVDISLRVDPEQVEQVRSFMVAHGDGFASLEQAAEAIANFNPSRRRRSSPEGLRKVLRQRDDGRWYWHWDPAYLQVPDERLTPAHADLLRKSAVALEIPVLIIRGGNSSVVSDEALSEMLKLMPQAEAVTVSGAGHMVAGDDNDIFARSLDGFLRAIDN